MPKPADQLHPKPRKLEGALDDLLQQLTPDAARTLQGQPDAIDDEIGKLVDRIVSASHARVVTAYEDKIDALERKKLILAEKAVPAPRKQAPFDETFEPGLRFLSNPYNLWKKGSFETKRLVLRLLFIEPIPYDRGNGFRTPQTSNVFRAFSGFSTQESEMVRPRRFFVLLPHVACCCTLSP